MRTSLLRWMGIAGLLLLGCNSKQDSTVIGMAETREVMVAAKLSGRLADVTVSEGDHVKAGQAVAHLASPEVEAKVEQARGMVKSAQARLDMARKGARSEELRMAETMLAQATEARKLAETTWNRVNKLLADSALSKQQADEVEFKWQAAKENEAAAQAKVDMTKKGARPEEIEAAEGAVESAQNALAEAQSWLKETSILSPVDGVVQKRYAGAGEITAAGAPILVLIRPEETWVALPLREDQLAALHLGDQVSADVPALSEKNVTFKVTWMTAMGDFATWRETSRRGDADLRSFEVRLEPVKPLPGFLPGMTVRVHLNNPKG